MPTVELNDEQLTTLRTIIKLFKDNDGYEDLAEDLEISPQDRGKENDDGEELEDYDEGNDPVFKRVGEVELLLNAAK